jgi:uncharacterized protein YecT (DUF1311 family)
MALKIASILFSILLLRAQDIDSVLSMMRDSFPDWNAHSELTDEQLYDKARELMVRLGEAEDEGQQQPMNEAVAHYYRSVDAHLYRIVAQQLSSIKHDERAPLIREQREWLRDRTSAVDSAYQEYLGGTLAPYAGGKVGVRLTVKRIYELTNGKVKYDE